MTEIWKPIRGYEGLYDISNKGRVRSYKNGKWGLCENPKVLVGYKGKHYLTVILCKEEKKTFTIHSLVADAFIPNPENKREVNHIDGNKLNNDVTNLEWVSHKENMQHAKQIDLFGKQKKVICVETNEVYASITKAAESLGIKQPTLSHALLKKNGKAGGYHWKLKEE